MHALLYRRSLSVQSTASVAVGNTPIGGGGDFLDSVLLSLCCYPNTGAAAPAKYVSVD